MPTLTLFGLCAFGQSGLSIIVDSNLFIVYSLLYFTAILCQLREYRVVQLEHLSLHS